MKNEFIKTVEEVGFDKLPDHVLIRYGKECKELGVEPHNDFKYVRIFENSITGNTFRTLLEFEKIYNRLGKIKGGISVFMAALGRSEKYGEFRFGKKELSEKFGISLTQAFNIKAVLVELGLIEKKRKERYDLFHRYRDKETGVLKRVYQEVDVFVLTEKGVAFGNYNRNRFSFFAEEKSFYKDDILSVKGKVEAIYEYADEVFENKDENKLYFCVDKKIFFMNLEGAYEGKCFNTKERKPCNIYQALSSCFKDVGMNAFQKINEFVSSRLEFLENKLFMSFSFLGLKHNDEKLDNEIFDSFLLL